MGVRFLFYNTTPIIIQILLLLDLKKMPVINGVEATKYTIRK
jgi:hypothetical protein